MPCAETAVPSTSRSIVFAAIVVVIAATVGSVAEAAVATSLVVVIVMDHSRTPNASEKYGREMVQAKIGERQTCCS
jgi:hypothetical protein